MLLLQSPMSQKDFELKLASRRACVAHRNGVDIASGEAGDAGEQLNDERRWQIFARRIYEAMKDVFLQLSTMLTELGCAEWTQDR